MSEKTSLFCQKLKVQIKLKIHFYHFLIKWKLYQIVGTKNTFLNSGN